MCSRVIILIAVILKIAACETLPEDDVIVIASNAVEDFGILESLTNATDNHEPRPDNEIQEAGVSRVLTIILRRGKELIKILPRLGIVIAKRLLDHVPSPAQVLNFAKQVLIGLPQEVIAFAIDVVCTTAIRYKALKPLFTPNVQAMNYILISAEIEEVAVPLNNSEALWLHPEFRMDWPVVILVTGWNSNINVTNEALDILYTAYRCRGEYNFVIIDTAQFVDTLYTWSAFSSKEVGQIVGEALAKLTRYVPSENVHLIGHSLGAHICGEAGRVYRNLTNQSLVRITGLDPARPCFNEGERLTGLQRGDANFVDIIHSNVGILGMKDPIGDIDFYPNGREPLQPGCWSIFCSHSRSYYYFAESIYPGNERNFLATKCSSLSAYRQGRCEDDPIPMGIATPRTARGSYFLETNKKSPFGKSSSTKRVTRWWTSWFGKLITTTGDPCKVRALG